MIDFPIVELLDEDECLQWLYRHLHPEGLHCPRCGSTERRVAQRNGQWSAYRCKLCDRYHTILTGTVFEKTRQPPSKIVLILGGIAAGQPTARLARELGIGRQRMHEIRKQIQSNLHYTLPPTPINDETLETDELYQNAGEKGQRHTDPDDPPRRRANKQPGHGTYENDRPPIFTVKGRESGHLRCFVGKSSGTQSCLEVVGACVGLSTSVLNTDEWSGYSQVQTSIGISHRTVRHGYDQDGRREWARDDDGDGVREVHCQRLCEGSGAPLRTFLRVFRGVHKEHLAGYVATFETMTNARRITGEILRRMCLGQYTAPSEKT